jgi:hypothetical protein
MTIGMLSGEKSSRFSKRLHAEGVSLQDDFGPFVFGVIDARKAVVRTDGIPAYLPLEELGVAHDRQVQGVVDHVETEFAGHSGGS